ncbi:MAG TPA: heme o synthase [Patescibacteria group bacterium]|nr:heme o synthase [Patescibacteria group bacterium]
MFLIETLRTYYNLTKPGIIYGNAINTAAGFLLATHGWPKLELLLATLVGSSLVIASGCVFNNYLDRGIDLWMARTQKRALVTGLVANRAALVYASSLGLVGFLVLAIWTNFLTVAIGMVGLFTYVIIYGWAKRKSVYSTWVGGIAGAVPPVAGYTAVTNNVNAAAWILFFMLMFWQIAHFYAIALYRLREYRKTGLPIWPVKKGIGSTQAQIMLSIIAFTFVSLLLTLFGYTGLVYAVVMGGAGLWWFWKGLKNLDRLQAAAWGRSMFLSSLIVTLVMAACLAVGGHLA